HVAFLATLDDGTEALFVSSSAGALSEVAREGGSSPAGGKFSNLRIVGVAANGRVGFRATVSAGPDGLFYADGARLGTLVAAGQASPAGGRFTSVGSASMNSTTGWAFFAVTADGRSGIFEADTTMPVPRLATVALENDPAPLGGTFRDFPSS